MSELRFLPWVQTGLSRGATGHGGRAVIGAEAEIGTTTHTRDLDLAGPGDVSSLDSAVWGRRFPAPGAVDAEETFLVSIEVTPADLPWRLSRGPADASGQLDPWMVLVVVEANGSIEVVDGVNTALQQLVISPDAAPSTQLPNLTERATWAHVQSTLDAATVEADPSSPNVIARLLCPRDLAAGTAYLAAVVPATAEGVLAGRGLATAAPTSTDVAWKLDDAALDANGITLPMYTSWTFSTGPSGDFESLARLIHGQPPGPRTGVAPLDITDPGPSVPPAPKPVVTDYHGALRAPEIDEKEWDAKHEATFQTALTDVLNGSVDRPVVPFDAPKGYDPANDDPVVAPPLYGEMAGLDSVPPENSRNQWARDLNLDPAWRGAAGLGSQAIRNHAHEYVAAAWQQLGDAPAAVTMTNRAIFSAATAQRFAATTSAAEDATLIGVVATLPVAERAGAHVGVPVGVGDPVLTRITRSSTALGRRFRDALTSTTTERDDVRTSSIAVSITNAHRAASLGVGSAAPVGDFAKFTGVSDALTEHLILTAEARLDPESGPPRVIDRKRLPRSRVGLPTSAGTSVVATTIRQQLDPSALIAVQLHERLPTGSPEYGFTPVPLRVELEYTTAIVDAIVEQSASYVMPGVEEQPLESAALTVVEGRHVASVLAGANHELLRELLWHGVPVSLDQTPIRRYWETGDPSDHDIEAIADWRGELSDLTVTAGSDDLSVFVVRATLFDRYPGTRLHLVGGTWDGTTLTADSTRFVNPVFEGDLGAALRYAAFAKSTATLVGNLGATRKTDESAGWFLAFEEAPTEPRFRPQAVRGANSAAHAAGTYQPPFRGLVHASEMLEPQGLVPGGLLDTFAKRRPDRTLGRILDSASERRRHG